MVRRIATALALAGASLSAQQPVPAPPAAVPTFQSEVNVIEVDALVRDDQGRAVRGLTRDDFQIFEDGRPQAISNFSVVDIPMPPALPAGLPTSTRRPGVPVVSDVASNAAPFDGRVYVMVVDDLHMRPGQVELFRKAADQFIEQNLAANDLMAIVHTFGARAANQDFTSNKALLLAAIEGTTVQGLRPAVANQAERAASIDPVRGGDPDKDPDDEARLADALATLRTLQSVVDGFGSVRNRRKAVLFVSEGIDYDYLNTGDTAHAFLNPDQPPSTHTGADQVLAATREVVDAATRANAAIYGIDPRGLISLETDTITDQYSRTQLMPRLGDNNAGQHDAIRLSQDSLRMVSDPTGGFAVVSQGDFATAFRRIVEDNSSYYVLAYNPSRGQRDGKFHKIEVRVDRPGVVVRARRGYVAPKTAPKPERDRGAAALRAALTSPVPVSGLVLQVFAAPFRAPIQTVGVAPDASVLIGIELRGRDLQLVERGRVALAYEAIDANGRTFGPHLENLTLTFGPETRSRAVRTGVRVLTKLSLPAGRYRLRVAARDEASGKLGSVSDDLDVPAFDKARLALSGVILTAAPGEGMATARIGGDPRPINELPAPPIALRHFSSDETVVLFTEAYADRAAARDVEFTTSVIAPDGRVALAIPGRSDATERQGTSAGDGYSARVPMEGLAAGSYILNVTARLGGDGGAVATREIPFTVLPPNEPQP